MGATVRREPISYKIPDNPDYKFLNVNDFRGINMSDNPFIVSPKTASDALNVYVDEQNALTTRPRLEKLFEKLKNITKFLGVYSISSGYLVHGMNGDKPVIWIVPSDLKSNGKQVTGDHIPKGKRLSVFEQNDNIYLLDGLSYTFINPDYVCNVVEGYIPTTRVGGTKTTKGEEFEQLNVLSNKYKESYFWDGNYNPSDLMKDETKSYELDVDNLIFPYNDTMMSRSVSGGAFTPVKILTTTYEGKQKILMVETVSSAKGIHYVVYDSTTSYHMRFLETVELPEALRSIISRTGDDWNIVANSSLNGNQLVVVAQPKDYADRTSTAGVLYVRRNDVWYNLSTMNTIDYSAYIDSKDLFIDELGNRVYVNGKNGLCIFSFDYTNSFTSTIQENKKFDVCSLDGMTIVTIISYGTGYTGYYSFDGGMSFEDYYFSKYPYTLSERTNLQLSDDGNTLMIGNCIFRDFKTKKLTDVVFTNINRDDILYFLSKDGERVFLIGINEIVKDETGWINIKTDEKINMPLIIPYAGNSDVLNTPEQNLTHVTLDSIYFITDEELTATPILNNEYFYGTMKINLNNREPTLVLTITLTENDTEYDAWKKRHNLFFETSLTTRFDNERWFASHNMLFRTSYNDPTYISNYNDLGDTDEEITGFNILQDDLLAVYKDSYIWTVSPTVTEDINGKTLYTYTYQESKNTVGNVAKGASIVSVYTEIPLQVTYDGVYGLKQISNVQSPARISELLSEGISKRWLKESRENIKKVKTLNRLYWTYFIFSYDKFTKIYLLDNRTMSWYYWELPIQTLDAMIKDNITIFVDTDGMFYKLTTEDIYSKFNPNRTEYYDEIKNKKEPIKWFWKSQILSLNTTNYTKRLVDTTFILADTDASDEYALNYKFKTYRKLANESGIDTISDKLNYIQSTTVKTKIFKFNFLQLEISNIDNDINNNKFRLVGLGLKYTLVGYTN